MNDKMMKLDQEIKQAVIKLANTQAKPVVVVPKPVVKPTTSGSTPMYWVTDGICYQGSTENKYVKAAAIPDSRQCAGPEIRGQGGVVGNCAHAGFIHHAGSV